MKGQRNVFVPHSFLRNVARIRLPAAIRYATDKSHCRCANFTSSGYTNFADNLQGHDILPPPFGGIVPLKEFVLGFGTTSCSSKDQKPSCNGFVPQDQYRYQFTLSIFVTHLYEGTLEVNRLFGGKYLFLFAQPTARVRAKAASSRHWPN
jgi:hypothetical protein